MTSPLRSMGLGRMCGDLTVTPHVEQKKRWSAKDGRTTRHEASRSSQKVRKREESIFGSMKTVGGFRRSWYSYMGVERTEQCGEFGGDGVQLWRIKNPMTSKDLSNGNICHECIGDEFLANEVRERDKGLPCRNCGETRPALTFDEMADRVHDALNSHYIHTSVDPIEPYEYFLQKEGLWDRSGEPVEFVIADMAGIEEDIARDLTELLSEKHGGFWIERTGEEDPYDSEAHYEKLDPDDFDFRETWASFITEIQSHARFFSPYVKEMFKSIFGDLENLKTHQGVSSIRLIQPGGPDAFVWRARVAQSRKDLSNILEGPIRELGPPPSSLSRAGRMNARGISVFYGAMDEETCVTEVRPPVGSNVAIGKFEIIRPVRILDIDALASIYATGSCFDETYAERQNRAALLRNLASELTRPVMPQDEDFEYLPTQAVAEYLANRVRPRLDGMIFRSTQRGGEGLNLALFNHACGVEQIEESRRNVRVKVNVPPIDVDDEADGDDAILVYEVASPGEESTIVPTSSQFGPFRIDLRDRENAQYTTHGVPTLRLDPDLVKVFRIERVKYEHRPREMHRRRFVGQPPNDGPARF